jgi:hypothetical protein
MAAKPNDSGTLAGKRGSGHDWTGEMTLGRSGRKQGRTDARFERNGRLASCETHDIRREVAGFPTVDLTSAPCLFRGGALC